MKHRLLLVSIAAFLVSVSLPAIPITWETTLEAYRGRYSEILTFELPPDGYEKPVYGMGEFDWDSSIGSAAVQMGLLTYQDGGRVAVLVKEGPEYTKGPDTYDWWNTTFVFLDAKGNVIKPDEGSIVFIDIPDEPVMAFSAPEPAFFTVSNHTGMTLTYLDISSSDMRAVGAHGKNLLGKTALKQGESRDIPFSDHPDLKSIILYRYGALLSVDAAAENGQAFSHEWRVDGSTLQIHILSEHLVHKESQNSLKVFNDSSYTLVELYILTPEMEAALNYSAELLEGRTLPSGAGLLIDLTRWPYLQSFFQPKEMIILSIEAYDEDGYPLFQYWLPDYDNLEITLSDWDYL